MTITKFGHSCVYIEHEKDGVRWTALFDPGVWSELPLENIGQLDDVFISHIHEDHLDMAKLQAILQKFPDARVTGPSEVVEKLHGLGISHADVTPPAGAALFVSPHEGHMPFMEPPQEIGVHFLDMYTHPGDSHSFSETKAVLGLPVQAPWGSTIDAVDLAIKLKPTYVLPIHDWHWRDEARIGLYERLETLLKEQGITFLKPTNGNPIQIAL
ncbi:MBL fold metallo-hydrolase [Candidatus Saccharibacteria bacterium]|nr:MBL fold metallo-hydrolase [Candidatus Saccharibacteria bacterium]